MEKCNGTNGDKNGTRKENCNTYQPMYQNQSYAFHLIQAFEIDLAVSLKDIGIKSISAQLTDPNNSNQMPILVRPISTNI